MPNDTSSFLRRLWAPTSPEIRRKLFAGLGITFGGFIVLLLATSLAAPYGAPDAFSPPAPGWVALIAVSGKILMVVGCALWAASKGYHWAFGLFGLVTIGLIVLALLPLMQGGAEPGACTRTVGFAARR